MADYFVCVDACVLVDLYVEIIRKGATPKGWEELKALVDSGEVKLLVPEVILMEFRKWVRRKLETVAKTGFTIQPPSGHADFDGVINEQLSRALQTPHDDWLKQKNKDWHVDSQKVLKLLNGGVPVEFTLEIQHRSKRRLVEGLLYKRPGKAGDDEQKRDQDCFIIDSLVDYFANHDDGTLDDKIVLFGTKDGGFGAFHKEPETIEKTGMLDKLFQHGLPPTKLFTNLDDLVKFIRTKGTINLLTEPGAMEKCVEAEVQETEESAGGPVGAVIAVPSAGKVIELFVRDSMTASDSVTATTTTTPPPSGWVGADWRHQGDEYQRRANDMALLRHLDEQRRRQNAGSDQVSPSFFAPPPDTKTARINWDEQNALAGQQLRRWTDPEGVAWRVGVSASFSVTGSCPPQVLITLDRSQAANAVGDVSEECDRFLRTLRFSYQRVVPQRRLGGVITGPYLEEVLDPEPLVQHSEPPQSEPPYADPPHDEVKLDQPPPDDSPPR